MVDETFGLDAALRRMEPEPDPDQTPETMAEWIARRGVTMVATFRGAGPAGGEFPGADGKTDPRSTHWGICIAYDGRQMFTEYHMGAAYWRFKKGAAARNLHPLDNGPPLFTVASVKDGEMVPHMWGRMSLAQESFLKEWSEPIPPDLPSVLDGLTLDALGVYNARDFEEWAGEYGYDPDSRKAESIYRACGKTYRDMEKLFGREVLYELLHHVERE